MIKSNFLKKLNKNDYATIVSFLIGFIFSAADMTIMNNVKENLLLMSTPFFWISYILMSIFMILTLKSFIYNGSLFKLESCKPSIQMLKLVLLGYYLGFLVNISNSFTIALFSNYFNFGGK